MPSLRREIVRAIVTGPAAWSSLAEVARRLPHRNPGAVRRVAEQLIAAGVLDLWSFPCNPKRRGGAPSEWRALTLSSRFVPRARTWLGYPIELADRMVRQPGRKRGAWALVWVRADEDLAMSEREPKVLRSTLPRWLLSLESQRAHETETPPPIKPQNGHHEAAQPHGCKIVPATLMGWPVLPLKPKNGGKRSRTVSILTRDCHEPENPTDN